MSSVKNPEALGYRSLTIVRSESRVKDLCTEHHVSLIRRCTSVAKSIYLCRRRCGFGLMVEEESSGNALLYHVFTRGEHSHEIVQGRPAPAWFDICKLESKQDVRATGRGYTKLKPSSNGEYGYYRCNREGCPNELRFIYTKDENGRMNGAHLGIRGEHNHEFW